MIDRPNIGESSLDIAICTYNRYDYLAQTIEAVLAQDSQGINFRLLIIDNSPDYGFAKNFGDQFKCIPQVRYIIERTPGLSNARNVATDMTDAPILVFLDDDAVVRPGWLKAIFSAFTELEEEVAVIGGRVLPKWEVSRPEWLDDSLIQYLSVVDWPANGVRLLKASEWVVGANVGYRTDALRKAGGFNTNLGRTGGGASLLSNEEIDLFERLRRRGFLAAYAPNACVDHLIPSTRLTKGWFRKRAAWQAVSDWLMRPEDARRWSQSCWEEVGRFMMGFDRDFRVPAILFCDDVSKEDFVKQVRAIHAMTIFSLSGNDLMSGMMRHV